MAKLNLVLAIKILLLFFWITTSSFSLAQQAPKRIVSLSLCSDLLLLSLADKENIISLSYLAADPDFSYLSNKVGDIPLNRGQAEEVLALNPDLILSSQFSASATVNLLKRLNHDVVVLDFPQTLEDSYAQIMQVASLIAEPARGITLIEAMRQAIQGSLSEIPESTHHKTAVFYSSNGYTHGSFSLRNNFLNQLQLKNLAADIGITGSAQLPIESLLMGKPDYLLIDQVNEHSNLLAHPMIKHRALKKAIPEQSVITLPSALFQCAGPSLVEAFAIMSKQLRQSGR